MRCTEARVTVRLLACAVALAGLVGCGASSRSGDLADTGGTGAGSAGVSSNSSGGAGARAGSTGAGGNASGAAGGSAGSSGGNGGTGTSGAGGDYFVSALVDGELLRAEIDVKAYWWPGLIEGWLGVEAETENRQWYFVVQESGTGNVCSYIVLAGIPEVATQDLASFWEGGNCEVALTHAAPNVGDILEGTFNAELKAPAGQLGVTVTEGEFRIPRIEDNPP